MPESLPVTQETRERLRSQANQLGEATVLRLVDLLAVAVDDARQGGDPRLPLELALVKVTRPGADLTRESLCLPARPAGGPQPRAGQPAPRPARPRRSREGHRGRRRTRRAEAVAGAGAAAAAALELDQIQQLWKQAVLPAVAGALDPARLGAREAKPVELEGEKLVVEFPPAASFHRTVAEKPENATILGDILQEVTGRRLAVAYSVGEGSEEEQPTEEGPTSEEEFVSLFKSTFDAREVDEPG